MEGLPINTKTLAAEIPAYAQLGLLSHLVTQRISKIVEEHLHPLHLSQIQYHALYALNQYDCWVRQRDLNGILNLPKKRLRNCLIELADRALIDRIVPPGTCRICERPACYACATLHITALGRDILKAADALVEDAYRELTTGFVPSEYESLLSSLRELSGVNLEARLGQRNNILTLTPMSASLPKVRPAG